MRLELLLSNSPCAPTLLEEVRVAQAALVWAASIDQGQPRQEASGYIFGACKVPAVSLWWCACDESARGRTSTGSQPADAISTLPPLRGPRSCGDLVAAGFHSCRRISGRRTHGPSGFHVRCAARATGCSASRRTRSTTVRARRNCMHEAQGTLSVQEKAASVLTQLILRGSRAPRDCPGAPGWSRRMHDVMFDDVHTYTVWHRLSSGHALLFT